MLTVVAHHVRSGKVGLNVVTAALDTDPRTEGVRVVFAEDVAQTIEALRTAPGDAVVAWSFYSPDADAAARDLAAVRRATPRGLHVAGGVHATAEPFATLGLGFDVAVVGEGESTFVELCARLLARQPLRGLAGTAYLDDGAPVTHGPGPRRELDAFPPFHARLAKWNPIEITRGCVYACTFCQTPYAFKARFRHRSVENVRAAVRHVHEKGGGYVRFLSPTSLSYGSAGTEPNLPAVRALLAGIRDDVGTDMRVYFGTFPSEVRPEHVTDEALEIIARYADNDSLIVGGQSGSERLLRETKRGHGVEDVLRAVERCKAHGFRADVDFLFGLPGETDEDRRLTIDLARRLVADGARIHAHAFMPLPGTPLRGAVPAELTDEVLSEMKRLEGLGAMYGQWRKHVVTADALVRRRQGAGDPAPEGH